MEGQEQSIKQNSFEISKTSTGNNIITELLQDSLEIGTPAKGGAIKIYTDFRNIELTKEKINNAFEMRKYANEKFNQE